MRLMATLEASGGEVQSQSSRATVATAMPSLLFAGLVAAFKIPASNLKRKIEHKKNPTAGVRGFVYTRSLQRSVEDST